MTDTLTHHAYSGRADLAPLLAFASRSFAQRSPLPATWHPGDVVWQLKGGYDDKQPIRLWEDPQGVVGVAWFDGPRELLVEVLPAAEHLIAEIAAWAEGIVRRRGEVSLSIRAFDADVRRIAALEALGYVKAAPEGVWFRIDLHTIPPAPPTPPGFLVRNSIGLDPARRAQAHRDAWNFVSHLGLTDGGSQFSEALYRSLAAEPAYDPSLDIVVQAPDGVLAANCIAWADAASATGVFEPVGTHGQFRGRALAGVAIHEALRRLKARGLRWARVGTAHFNGSAISAYRRSGFELVDRSSWWSKML